MQDEHLGFRYFQIFFNFCLRGNNIFTLNQAFIKKDLEIPISKIFHVGTRSKTSFLTSTTTVNIQQMSKI